MNLKNLFKKEKRDEKELTAEDLAKIWDEYCWRGYENILSTRCFRSFFKELEQILICQPGGIVLDGGCGTGGEFRLILEKIKPSKIVAVDFSESMLEKAKKEAKRLVGSSNEVFEFQKVDLTRPFPWQDNTFDAEIFNLLICYLPNGEWEKVLREAYRTLKPSGYCYITTAIQKDFRKEVRKRFFSELLSPVAFLKAIKVIPAVKKLDDFVKKGVIESPQRKEVIQAMLEIGFSDIYNAIGFGKTVALIRATKT